MNLRFSGTSTCFSKAPLMVLRLELRRSPKTSAMATSLMGPDLVEREFSAAPVPRPPQPTRATWMVSSPAAWTAGRERPARAEAVAPAVSRAWRRDGPPGVVSFTEVRLLRFGRVVGGGRGCLGLVYLARVDSAHCLAATRL